MNRIILLLVLFIGITTSIDAQKKRKQKYLDVETLTVGDFNTWKPNTLKKTKRLFIPRTSIHFKTTTNESSTFGKGLNSTTVGAWAVLTGISDETRQSLVNDFYDYLTKGIQGLGIEVVPFDQVTSSSAFTKFSEKQIDREFSNKNYGVNQVFTYGNGPHTKPLMGNPGIWNATKKLAKELKANALIIDVTVDFTRFELNFKKDKSVFYNAGFVNGYSYDKVYTSTKAKSAAIPQITIPTSNGATGFNLSFTGASIADAKGLMSSITLEKETLAKGEFAVGIEAYEGKLPSNMKKFVRIGDHMDTGTFMITGKDDAYKLTVWNALKNYADALIATMKAERG